MTTMNGEPEQADGSSRRPRILLVEDNDDMLRLMTEVLTIVGCDVTPAGNVASALDCAGQGRFDLVVSDLGLPDGSGIDLMRQLRDKHGLRGVALSGHGLEEDRDQSLAAGFVEHLVKPVDLQTLRASVFRCVG